MIRSSFRRLFNTTVTMLLVCSLAMSAMAAPKGGGGGGSKPGGGGGSKPGGGGGGGGGGHGGGDKSGGETKPAEDEASDASDLGGFPLEWFIDAKNKHYRSMIGKPMPSLDNLDDFVPDDAGSYVVQGKVGVIVFFTQFDETSIAALGKLEPLWQKFKAKRFGMLAVCTNYPQDRCKAVLKEQKVTYPGGRDKDYGAMRSWRPSSWPAIAVVDAKGNVRAIGVKASRVEDVVVALLKEANKLPAEYAIKDAERAVPLGAKSDVSTPATGDKVAGDKGPATQPGDATASSGTKSNDKSGEKSGEKKPAEKTSAKIPPAGAPIPREWLEGTDAQRTRLQPIEQQMATTFAVKDWINIPDKDQPPRLNWMAGSVVVIVFWNPGNGASVASVPKLNAIYEKYKDNEDFSMVAVCTTKAGEKMPSVVASRKIKYMCAVDDNGQTEAAYQADGYDDYYLLGKNGKLRIADCDNDSLEMAIEYLLQEKLTKMEQVRVTRVRNIGKHGTGSATGG